LREIRIDLGYRPRSIFVPFHKRTQRRAVLVVHRRAGKTVANLADLIDAALRCPLERPRYAYLAPLYKQAKAVAWDYLKAMTAALPGRVAHEAELRVELPNGARIQLYGADNPDALRGIYLDGAVLDEYAQMAPKAWTEVIGPALADRKGFATFIGTPKGRNAFCELYERAKGDPAWYTALHRASETGLLSADVLNQARAEMAPEEFEQEFECSFQAALVGAYYGKPMADAEKAGRIGKVPWDPAHLVDTAWDLGIDDATCIWFVQQVGREVRVIDFYEASGVGLEHYAKVLREKPYTFGRHLLPHDVEHYELGTGKSRADVLRGLGVKVTPLPQAPVEDGIQAVRSLLPRCWFDETACGRGIEALRQYQREYDDRLQTFKARPRHDWASHAADAFRYLAMGLRDATPRPMPAMQQTDYDPLGYGLSEPRQGRHVGAFSDGWDPLAL
jgi:phage terminase large subunit